MSLQIIGGGRQGPDSVPNLLEQCDHPSLTTSHSVLQLILLLSAMTDITVNIIIITKTVEIPRGIFNPHPLFAQSHYI